MLDRKNEKISSSNSNELRRSASNAENWPDWEKILLIVWKNNQNWVLSWCVHWRLKLPETNNGSSKMWEFKPHKEKHIRFGSSWRIFEHIPFLHRTTMQEAVTCLHLKKLECCTFLCTWFPVTEHAVWGALCLFDQCLKGSRWRGLEFAGHQRLIFGS